MNRHVHTILWNRGTDTLGRLLALVIYTDRSWEYVPHTAF